MTIARLFLIVIAVAIFTSFAANQPEAIEAFFIPTWDLLAMFGVCDEPERAPANGGMAVFLALLAGMIFTLCAVVAAIALFGYAFYAAGPKAKDETQ